MRIHSIILFSKIITSIDVSVSRLVSASVLLFRMQQGAKIPWKCVLFAFIMMLYLVRPECLGLTLKHFFLRFTNSNVLIASILHNTHRCHKNVSIYSMSICWTALLVTLLVISLFFCCFCSMIYFLRLVIFCCFYVI
jgi:hypothetical protein